MEKIIKMKPGETMAGLFKAMSLEEVGYAYHIYDPKRKRYQAIRSEALKHNNIARLLKEVEQYQVKFSVLTTLKEGYTSIVFVDHSKVEV